MIGHLLVPYISRSGSTLLLNYLSQYKDFCVCLEADILVKHFLQQPYKKNTDPSAQKKTISLLVRSNAKLSAWRLKPSDINIIASKASYLEIFLCFLNQYQKRHAANAKIIVFKAVEIVDVFEKLKTSDIELFNIKYLALLRDPRACFASQLTTIDPYSNQAMNKNPLITAYTWNKLVEKSMQFKEKKPHSLIQLKYEDFVLNPQRTISKISELFSTTICNLKSPKSDWLISRIPSEQKQIHHSVNLSPNHNKTSAWKNKLKKSTVSIIQNETKGYRQTLGYIDELEVNTLWNIIIKYYYKFRIFFLIDRY